MNKVFSAVAAFFIVQLLTWYVIWVGGFDFDSRTPIIGYLAFVGIMAGVVAALFAYENTKE